MTTREEIKQWFDTGKRNKEKFMTVVCDTFDWEDFPVYGDKPHKPGEMEKNMEVYDLSKPFEQND